MEQTSYMNFQQLTKVQKNQENMNSYLLETDKKIRPQYMTQDVYSQPSKNRGIEETITKQQQQRRQNTQKENGYLGQIVFKTNQGAERQFRLFQDSSLGLGQGCQSIVIDQEWDEDIETDFSCAENAVQKCMKQLNQAVRNQKKGIDPVKPYIHDYQTCEERFQKENRIIQNDQQHNNQQFQNPYTHRIDESPLIQSRSRIFSQMQNMMNSNDVNQISDKYKSDEDIIKKETIIDNKNNCQNNNNNSYSLSQHINQTPQINFNFSQYSQKTNDSFDPYFYQKLSYDQTQQSQYKFIPDYPSISASHNNLSQQNF